ncbi:hypothetical protein F444_18559 [Phytophthora nicotianae P1976]|uniref:Uncharacterized protein n=1 Tax=Phytophthora nicotianae P1976 TaxID=1317066 RepID=A0A080ZAZ5_PHYNI|nr:hypothetical protein F444_18559 [Phytophthora nicotianae P1976]
MNLVEQRAVTLGIDTRSSAISSGDGPIKVGKDPMTFSLYRSIAMEMMRSASREMIFARVFLVLSWELMSRSANTVSLCYNHMEWGEDALKVFFAHMMNAQRGTRPRDPPAHLHEPTDARGLPNSRHRYVSTGWYMASIQT